LDERVLAINPGSTSTKFGVYLRGGAEWVRTIRHGDEELVRFQGRPILARLDYRARLIAEELAQAGYSPQSFAATAGRGGLLPPMPCGTYLVDEAIVEELQSARNGEHASNLGALLALEFARAAGTNAYIVDPVTVDEWPQRARLSGSPLIARKAIGHALNTKAVAKRYAREQGQHYEGLRLVVAHMGSGITVSAHAGGRMIDNNTLGEGPMGPDRAGSVPALELVKLCYSGEFAQKEMERKVFGDGGLVAYLGTRDLEEIERRIAAGDRAAALVVEAMLYQIGKWSGAMAAALEGRVDAVLLTGGMAYSQSVIEGLRPFLGWIAPIHVYPGEDELEALAQGVFRVLDGEEPAHRLWEEGRSPAEAANKRKALTFGIDN
jgi:butyrate kinase